MKIVNPWLIAILGLASCVSLSEARGEVLYSAGHADIGLAYEDDGLFLHYHFGNATLDGATVPGDVEFKPSDVYTIVSNQNQVTLTPSLVTNYGAPLGKASGENIWVLQEIQQSGTPFLGLATEELDPFSGEWSDIAFELVGFNYEGDAANAQFTLWNSSIFGVPNYFMQTINGVDPAEDVLPITAGTHGHFSWGFSDPGLYELTIRGRATNATDGYVSDTGTFSFLVGGYEPTPVSPVPEPTSLALFGIGAVSAVVVGRNRRKKAKQDA